MANRTIALLVAAFLSGASLPALAQGAGGGGGAAGASGTAAPAGGTSGTTSNASTGGTAQQQTTAGQSNPAAIVRSEQSAAVHGTKTIPATGSAADGVVSAPGVGVGHSANGLPIGSPGSGLGSPEHSAGSTR
jgi:hypothetical protein